MIRRRRWNAALVISALAVTVTTGAVVGESPAARAEAVADGTYTNAVYAANAADPATLRAPDGSFYAYTTQTSADGTGPHIPILHSDDLVHWSYVRDALPVLPQWATDASDRDTWAPHVIAHQGRYLLYYSVRKQTGSMAIAVAESATPDGPFHPTGDPLIGGNSIDPFVMKTPRGLYMYWMVPREPIRVQRLSDDGTSLVGSPRTILRPAPGRPYEKLIEGPWVIEHNDRYYLFYSGNHCCAPNPHYAVMVARSRYPRRGFKRYAGNPILTANASFLAPGHNSVQRDDAGKEWMLYHAIDRSTGSYDRYLMLDRIRWLNRWPRINGGNGPSHAPRDAPVVSGAQLSGL